MGIPESSCRLGCDLEKKKCNARPTPKTSKEFGPREVVVTKKSQQEDRMRNIQGLLNT